MIINTEHPLSVDSHIFDKEGKEHYFVYFDIKDKPGKFVKEGYISHGEEVITGIKAPLEDSSFKHWGHKETCPYDYFIKGEKNPPVGRIKYIMYENNYAPPIPKGGIYYEDFIEAVKGIVKAEKKEQRKKKIK